MPRTKNSDSDDDFESESDQDDEDDEDYSVSDSSSRTKRKTKRKQRKTIAKKATTRNTTRPSQTTSSGTRTRPDVVIPTTRVDTGALRLASNSGGGQLDTRPYQSARTSPIQQPFVARTHSSTSPPLILRRRRSSGPAVGRILERPQMQIGTSSLPSSRIPELPVTENVGTRFPILSGSQEMFNSITETPPLPVTLPIPRRSNTGVPEQYSSNFSLPQRQMAVDVLNATLVKPMNNFEYNKNNSAKTTYSFRDLIGRQILTREVEKLNSEYRKWENNIEEGLSVTGLEHGFDSEVYNELKRSTIALKDERKTITRKVEETFMQPGYIEHVFRDEIDTKMLQLTK